MSCLGRQRDYILQSLLVFRALRVNDLQNEDRARLNFQNHPIRGVCGHSSSTRSDARFSSLQIGQSEIKIASKSTSETQTKNEVEFQFPVFIS